MYIKFSNYRFSSFLSTVMVIALAYFSGRKVVDDPVMLMGVISACIAVALFIKKPAWALAILSIAGINFFSIFRFTDLPFIPLSGLGHMLAHDILLLLFLGIIFLEFFGGKRNISLRSSIGYPIIALILLTILQAARSFLEGADFHFIMCNVRPFAYYLTYFLLLMSFKREDELIQFVKLIVIIAVITAGVTYFQTITGGLNLVTKIDYRPEFGIYQSLNLGFPVMVCVFLSLFSLSIGKKISVKYLLPTKLILLWVGGAILLILSRGVWVSTLMAVGTIIILNISQIKKSAVVLLFLMFVFFIVWSPIVERLAGSTSLYYVITKRVFDATEDIKYMCGSFEKRTRTMQIRWNYMIDNNPILGVGIKKPTLGDRGPTVISGHNLVGDLAVAYGLSGFFVMGWLLFTVFRKGIRLFRTLPDSWQKSLVCGLLAFNIQIVILSYSATLLFHTWGIVIIAPSWAVLELVDRFHRQGEKKFLTAGAAQ